MPRLFISLNCNEQTKNLLVSVQEMIRAQSVKGNFSRPENLHLTLVFIGETPAEQVPVLCQVIDESVGLAVKLFQLAFSRAGCFRQSDRELWWLGVEQKDPGLRDLNELRQRLTDVLSAKGFAFDAKQFKAHITLGREIKPKTQIKIPEQRIIFPVNRVSLMKSERINSVLVYSEIFGKDLSI